MSAPYNPEVCKIHTDRMNRFRQQVRTKREELGLTRRDLALAIGGDYSYVTQIESGSARPGLRSFLRIAAVLKIDLNGLVQ